jgi:hypothetical protein
VSGFNLLTGEWLTSSAKITNELLSTLYKHAKKRVACRLPGDDTKLASGFALFWP